MKIRQPEIAVTVSVAIEPPIDPRNGRRYVLVRIPGLPLGWVGPKLSDETVPQQVVDAVRAAVDWETES